MKQKIILLFLAISIFMLTSCSQLSNINKSSLSTEEKLEDFNYLYDMLEENHKNVYANITKQQLENAKQETIDIIPTLSDSEFYYELMHFISLIGDAHTYLDYTKLKSNELKVLGFDIAKFENGWYLLKLEQENQQYLGFELVGINDMSIDDIVDKTKSIVSYENNAWVEYQFPNIIHYANALKYIGVISEFSNITLSIRKNSDSDIERIDIKPISQTEFKNTKMSALTPKKIPDTSVKEIYRSMELDENTYYIQYNSCREDPNLPMDDFVKKVTTEIVNNSYKKIIIDLRYNSGGSSPIFEPMINSLHQLQRNQKFSTYTLIGSTTFSSAMINAMQLRRNTYSLFVGSQTGGNVNAYGEVKAFYLPNSGIRVGYSTNYFELIRGYSKDSLYPDIPVEDSLENYMNGIDSVVETVIKL